MFKIQDSEKLKSKLASIQKDPEVVSENDFIRAKTNVSIMTIENTEDAFLYYASLNLLNTYVKQNKNAISYKFKQEAISGFDSIIVNKIPGVTYSYDETEKVLIVNVSGFQFSFHNATPSAKMDFAKNFSHLIGTQFYKPEKWEGLRLQPYAVTVFTYASGLEGLTNKSLAGNLKEAQEEEIKHAGEIATQKQPD